MTLLRLLCSVNGLKISLNSKAVFQPMRSKTNRTLHVRFSRASGGLQLLWLNRVITLVRIFRQSFENRANGLISLVLVVGFYYNYCLLLLGLWPKVLKQEK